jgi:hypothetical protein
MSYSRDLVWVCESHWGAGGIASAFGHGGATGVTEASGLMHKTVTSGVRELEAGAGRSVRAPGRAGGCS